MPELPEMPEPREGDNQALRVSLTISILAVIMAAASLLGHRAHTEELLLQTQATDQWGFYQAKNTRLHQDEAFADLISTLSTSDPAHAHALAEKYTKEAERYSADKGELSNEARGLERDRDKESRRADRFDGAEALLEISIVLVSITLLTRRRMFWLAGTALGLIGILVAILGFFVR